MSGEDLKWLRAYSGLTQHEVGLRLGMAPAGARSKISRLETGAQPISKGMALRLAALFREAGVERMEAVNRATTS